jgi:hypothetical protein
MKSGPAVRLLAELDRAELASGWTEALQLLARMQRSELQQKRL